MGFEPHLVSGEMLLPIQPPLQTNQTPMPSYRVERSQLPETIHQEQTSNLHLHCRQILAEGERFGLPCGVSHGCFRGSSLTSWGQPSFSSKSIVPCFKSLARVGVRCCMAEGRTTIRTPASPVRKWKRITAIGRSLLNHIGSPGQCSLSIRIPLLATSEPYSFLFPSSHHPLQRADGVAAYSQIQRL